MRIAVAVAAVPAVDVRPNGTLALWNVPVNSLISIAYPGHVPIDGTSRASRLYGRTLGSLSRYAIDDGRLDHRA